MWRRMILASVLAATILGRVTGDPNSDEGCEMGSRLVPKPYALTGTSGELTSYNYSAGNYTNNLRCFWTITAPEDMVITMHFPHFDVEGSYGRDSCAFDNLTVLDTADLSLKQFCNNAMPSNINSKGNQLVILFASDQSITNRGFRIEWSAAQKTGVTIPPPQPQDNQCGNPEIPHYKGNSGTRIHGGRYVRPGSWPWQVQIKWRRGTHHCGGSLIHPQWVLTAAHCYTDRRLSIDPYSFTYHVGSHNLRLKDPKEVKREAAKVYKHPDHTPPSKIDVALVKLSEPVELNDHVGIICLPKPGAADPPEGSKCYVTGWGATTNSWASKALKQAEVPIVGMDRCKKAYGARIDPDNLCTGYEEGGHDSCLGDSGGPLHCQKPDSSWEQVGVTSWGEKCALPGKFGVYARVSDYTEWIKKTMALDEQA